MLARDARALWQILRGQSREGSHKERLEAFYGPQADRYDAWREGLLHGRRQLMEALAPVPGARVVELGGGTGRNLEFFGSRLASFERVDLVDLCAPMLDRARTRTAAMGNVHVAEADATTWRPEQPADIVYFSYSLTMIPAWWLAVDNALAMLKPGGLLGVVDFHARSRSAPKPLWRDAGVSRRFWPAWLAHDGVHPNPDHLPYLESRAQTVLREERLARAAFFPGLQVPHYLFIGRAPGGDPRP